MAVRLARPATNSSSAWISAAVAASCPAYSLMTRVRCDLENPFGAQEHVRGVGRGFQAEPFDQLVVRRLGGVVENRFQQADAEHLPNLAAAGLVGGRVFAIGLHPPQASPPAPCAPKSSRMPRTAPPARAIPPPVRRAKPAACSTSARSRRSRTKLRRLVLRKSRNWPRSRSARCSQPFLRILSSANSCRSTSAWSLRLGNEADQVNSQRRPIEADQPVQPGLVGLGRLAQLGPIGARKNGTGC